MWVRVLACMSVLTSAVIADPLQYSITNLANCVEAGHQRYISAREVAYSLLLQPPSQTAQHDPITAAKHHSLTKTIY
ncbi:hypothetical protein J6590_045644 [Homalodisca vitripennis]|nr:hypothetical protein J6590_045644 [Homalodisca vitripennis]